MLKLQRLVYAMAEREGWQPTNADNNFLGSASYRRQNPLNLRSSPLAIGTEKGFCVFSSTEEGFAAACLDIIQKARGNTSTGLNGKSTISDLIHVWAPESDGNDPIAYLKDVLTYTGFTASMPLEALLQR